MTGYFRKNNLLFYGYYFTYYASNCCYYGFLIRYLSSYGYSAFACGVVNMVVAMVSLLIQPLAGYITDTFLPTRKYLVMSDLLCMALVFLLPLTVSIPIVPVISILLFSSFQTPATYLTDSWSITLREKHPYLDYGKNRSGGSLGYSILAVISGSLVARFGYLILFVITFLMVLCNLILILQIPPIPCKNKAQNQEKKAKTSQYSFTEAVRLLCKNKDYLIFLFTAAFYSISLRSIGTYCTYKVEAIGGGDVELGIALALQAILEIPFLLLMSSLLKHFKLNALYLLCLIFMFIRNFTFAIAPNFAVLYLSQCINACSYGIFVAVSLELINRMVPPEIRATSITIMVAINNGLMTILTSLGGGWIIDRYGIDTMSWIGFWCMTLSLVVHVLYCLHMYFRHRERYV